MHLLITVNYVAMPLTNRLYSQTNPFTPIDAHYAQILQNASSVLDEMSDFNYRGQSKAECTNRWCHVIYTLFMNSKSLPPFPAPARGDHPGTEPRLRLNSKCFSLLKRVSSSAVGWRGPLSRLGGASKRHPDVMAPHHCQALPHTVVWVLQPRHPGGSSWSSAEPGCWQLEGEGCVLHPCLWH